MRFDLVDLRLFDAVVQAGSISAGAQARSMALASASARISGMETALGVKLLDRGRRGVSPTPAGLTLLQHARAITGQVERMRGDLRAFATGLKGEIHMVANTASLVELLPAALPVFLAANPDVDIDLEEMTSAEIVDTVANGRAEFGVIADSADTGQLETIALSSDVLVLIAPALHPFATRGTIAFAEALHEPFVGIAGGALQDHLAGHAARLGRRINYRVRLRSFDAIARLVEAGVGVGVMPLVAAQRLRSDVLAIVPLSDAWAHRRLKICTISFDRLSRHARSFVDEIARCATDPPLK